MDLAHASLIVPHQLSFWAAQFQEICLVWDLDPGPQIALPAYRQRWEQGLAYQASFEAALGSQYPAIKFLEVQADLQTRRKLARQFFPGLELIPAKDFRGGPFLAYFYALAAVSSDWVLHIDSDMLFAGCAQGWLSQALESLQSEPRLLCVSPSGGPAYQPETRESQFFSSRSFFIDRRRLYQALTCSYRPPEIPNGVEPFAELPENLISLWMRSEQLWRLELPGQGLWSLHPPVPPLVEFLPALPVLLQKLAQQPQKVPESQYGKYNLQADSLREWIQS